MHMVISSFKNKFRSPTRTSWQQQLLILLICILATVSCTSTQFSRKGEKKETIPKLAKEETARYVASFEDWKTERLQKLLAPKSWFSLTGLYWLGEDGLETFTGESLTGSVEEGLHEAIKSLYFKEDSVCLNKPVTDGVKFEGQLIDWRCQPKSTILNKEFSLEPMHWYIIERGNRLAVRTKDASIPSRIRIAEIPYYPFDPELVVNAKYTSNSGKDSMDIVDVFGMSTKTRIAGTLTFDLLGERYQLKAIGNDKALFVMVSDETTGFSTYGGGRYLYPESVGSDGYVILDFNRLQNPPCVFTDYATCPLPPPFNHIPIKIEAGEKKWDH